MTIKIEARRTLPLLITFLTGVLVIFVFFWDIPILTEASKTLYSWGTIIMAFAILLGSTSLTLDNVRNIIKRGAQWPFSVLMVILLGAFIAVGFALGIDSATFKWMWGFQVEVAAAFYGLTMFTFAEAAVRSFRVRSVETLMLISSGVWILIGNTAIGALIWGGFPEGARWLVSVINGASMRGIIIGSAVGIIVMGLRTLLGYERAHIGGLRRGE